MRSRIRAESPPLDIIPLSLLAAVVYSAISLPYLFFMIMFLWFPEFEEFYAYPVAGLSLVGLWRLTAGLLTTYMALDAFLGFRFLKRPRHPWGLIFSLAILAMIGHQWIYSKIRDMSHQWSAAHRIPLLIRDLESGDKELRCEAMEKLRWYGPRAKDSVPLLIRALEDFEGSIRCSAIYCLARIGPEARDALPIIEKMVDNDPDQRVRNVARDVRPLIGKKPR